VALAVTTPRPRSGVGGTGSGRAEEETVSAVTSRRTVEVVSAAEPDPELGFLSCPLGEERKGGEEGIHHMEGC
jgi:hypothetical protein